MMIKYNQGINVSFYQSSSKAASKWKKNFQERLKDEQGLTGEQQDEALLPSSRPRG